MSGACREATATTCPRTASPGEPAVHRRVPRPRLLDARVPLQRLDLAEGAEGRGRRPLGLARRWSGRPRARRPGTTSSRCPGSAPSAPRSTCTTPKRRRQTSRPPTRACSPASAAARISTRTPHSRMPTSGTPTGRGRAGRTARVGDGAACPRRPATARHQDPSPPRGPGREDRDDAFGAGVFFFIPLAIIYGIVTNWHEPVGAAALFLTGGLALLIGLFFWITSRRIDPRPEDDPNADISEGAGEQGVFAPVRGGRSPLGLLVPRLRGPRLRLVARRHRGRASARSRSSAGCSSSIAASTRTEFSPRTAGATPAAGVRGTVGTPSLWCSPATRVPGGVLSSRRRHARNGGHLGVWRGDRQLRRAWLGDGGRRRPRCGRGVARATRRSIAPWAALRSPRRRVDQGRPKGRGLGRPGGRQRSGVRRTRPSSSR